MARLSERTLSDARRLAELPADWPNREASSFLKLDGIRWHFQRMGKGPRLLLIHGTAASTHSWRDLAPLLAGRFELLIPDLPGQGFTHRPPSFRPSLENMDRALGRLLRELAFDPVLVVGHSAGAAVAIEMTLKGTIAPQGLVSLNGALLPFHGAAGRLFPTLAKLLFLNPVVPRLYTWSAGDARRVRRMLEASGSEIDERCLQLYLTVLRDRQHVTGALSMMAHWDLEGLAQGLRRLNTPLLLVVGENDKAIAPAQADTVAERAANARVERLPGLGHLAHEEDPESCTRLIEAFARELGVLGQDACAPTPLDTSVSPC